MFQFKLFAFGYKQKQIKISLRYFGTTSNENYFCIHVNHSSLSDLRTWWVMPVILLEHSWLVS